MTLAKFRDEEKVVRLKQVAEDRALEKIVNGFCK